MILKGIELTAVVDPSRAVFDRLTRTDVPIQTTEHFDTACVLGGSIAGLLAARVLADYARTVVIIERDEVTTLGHPRSGVPQDRQGHGLLPGGLAQIERWLPGFTGDVEQRGGVLARPEQQAIYFGAKQQMQKRDTLILSATRPFLESAIRGRVLALPNVVSRPGRVTGLEFRDDAVRAVRCLADGDVEDVILADFVVDAMGRSSKSSDWVERAGFQRPPLRRLRSVINYVTTLFEREEEAAELPVAVATARVAEPPAPDGFSVATVLAVEGGQWLVTLMSYEPDRPPRSVEVVRAACAKLQPIFGQATSGKVIRDSETYRQGDSRRRDYAELSHFPARLISVGDSAASFNPIHGQGISSAALHASCLSEYLSADPQLNRSATDFFDLQQVITDAAWVMSAGDDATRLDAIEGVEVSADAARERWAMQQILEASLVDQTIAKAFNDVTSMLSHPASLADPVLIERAIACNQRVAGER